MALDLALNYPSLTCFPWKKQRKSIVPLKTVKPSIWLELVVTCHKSITHHNTTPRRPESAKPNDELNELSVRQIVNRPGPDTIVISGVIYVKDYQGQRKLEPGNIRVDGFKYKARERLAQYAMKNTVGKDRNSYLLSGIAVRPYRLAAGSLRLRRETAPSAGSQITPALVGGANQGMSLPCRRRGEG